MKFVSLLRMVALGIGLTICPSVQAQNIPNRASTNINYLIETGTQKYSKRQYVEALHIYTNALQALQSQNNQENRPIETKILQKIGNTYGKMQQYDNALKYLQKAFSLAKILKSVKDEASIQNDIGGIYRQKGELQEALKIFQEALRMRRLARDKEGESRTLNNIGTIYEAIGQYPKALNCYEQTLSLAQELGNRRSMGAILNNIGMMQVNLGQYDLALDSYQKSLVLSREAGDREGESNTLHNTGFAYSKLNNSAEALKYYQQALSLQRSIKNPLGEANTLNNLGDLYTQNGQLKDAVETLQQALALLRQIGYRDGEGNTLDSLGTAFKKLNQHRRSLELYRQAMTIFREIGNRVGERSTLSNIGDLFNKQNQPSTAIIFYKQSVNLTEQIRQDLKVLNRETQKSYTETITDTYRSLADLLLKQGRILEAQQVLELLKIQEIRDFTRNIRAGDQTEGIGTSPNETKILDIHNSWIALGLRIDKCQQTKCSNLSQLNDRREVLTNEFNIAVRTLEKEIRIRLAQDDAFFDPRKIQGKSEEIVSSQPSTVLIYPFVLEDKIWILWTSKGGITKSIEILNVGKEQLRKLVLEMRTLLKWSSAGPEDLDELKTTSKKLYDLLIPPDLNAELEANHIQNLVFSLDSITRYIPMSVLYDGNQYLIQKYNISTILTADTDISNHLPQNRQNLNVIAGGVSKVNASEVSKSTQNFDDLPNVAAELNAIVRSPTNNIGGIFTGTILLNQEFNRKALRDNIPGHQILHIATHGKFAPDSMDASYLVLGDGKKLSIQEIPLLTDLTKVHLVVLSACETALGGAGQDGKEIAGISYSFLNGGAKAVIASLWAVNDDSTRMLMEQFYINLAKGLPEVPATKSNALRQAQISLIQSSKYSYPYYWAPFILIGNWL